LNRFLLSSSAVGSDKIMEIQTKIEKEMDQLFKPNGTKPELNHRLKQLKEIEQRLNELKAKNDTYISVIKDLNETEKKIIEFRECLDTLDLDFERKREWNRIYPYVKKRDILENQIAELKNIPFPKDGMERYKQLTTEKKTKEKQLSLLKERMERAKQELEPLKTDENLLEKSEEIQNLLEEYPGYRHQREALSEERMEISRLTEELEEFSGKLGIKIPEADLLELNLNFALKDTINQLEQEKHRLKEKRRELDKEEEGILERIKTQEKWLSDLMRKALSEEDRIRIEKMKEREEERKVIKERLEWINQQLLPLTKKSSKKKKTLWKKYVFIPLILLISFILFFINQREIALGLMISLFVFIAYLIVDQKGKDQETSFYEMLNKEKEGLQQRLQAFPFQEDEVKEAEKKLAQHLEIQGELERERLKRNHLEEQFQQLREENEKWEAAWKKNEQSLVEIGQSLLLSDYLSKHYLFESLNLLEKMKEKAHAKRNAFDKVRKLEEQVFNYESRLDNLDLFNAHGKDNDAKIVQLKKWYQEEQEKAEKIRTIKEKLAEIEEDIDVCEKEISLIDQEIQMLFRDASASSEKEFIESWEKIDLCKRLEEQCALAIEELDKAAFDFKKEMEEGQGPYPESVFQDIDDERKKIRQEIQNLEETRASLKHQVEVLEEGGTFTEWLHRYYEEKYEFNEISRKWASLSLSRYLLQKSMETFKGEKLPALLTKAESYFSAITEHNYRHIYLHAEKDEMIVERKDGQIFSPEELSQATQEQLYISIRFALAECTTDTLPVPILIDDGFVHFDEKRLQAMMGLLKEVAKKRQILFFTCHEKLLPYFKEENVLQLD